MTAKVVPFLETLRKHKIELTRRPLEVLQVNVGKLCNQACHHCHVEAGPKRTEIMEKRTMDRLLELLQDAPTIHTVDITGGAPELNPHFRYFVSEIRSMKKEVIDRCNLTVIFEMGQETTAQFLRDECVQVVASLPCYSKENVDKQRGNGVFDKSIRALRMLNELGYGRTGTGLQLHLVYNPLGGFLPPSQAELEKDYKDELKNLFGIEFNHLYTITNMPIKRFLRDLERLGKFQEYMELLVSSFNTEAALGVMCRSLVSVGWDGQVYDCDFNQMLEIPLACPPIWKKRTIWNVERLSDIAQESIALADHCYGCTAGAGSSCGGALV
jgi:radical SAM/Cys-rich protein